MPSWNLLFGGPSLTDSKFRFYHSELDLPQIKRFHFEIHLENSGVAHFTRLRVKNNTLR